jgi:hypothetical protein
MPNISSTLAIATALLAFSAVQADARDVTVKGLGNKPCSQWTQAHQGRKPDAALQETWLAGFVTGFNAYGLKESKDVAAGADLNGIVSPISRYCSAHPSDDLFKAAAALLLDLQKKSGAK